MTEVYRQDVFLDAPPPEGEGWVLVHAQCEVFRADAGRKVRDEVRWWTRVVQPTDARLVIRARAEE